MGFSLDSKSFPSWLSELTRVLIYVLVRKFKVRNLLHHPLFKIQEKDYVVLLLVVIDIVRLIQCLMARVWNPPSQSAVSLE